MIGFTLGKSYKKLARCYENQPKYQQKMKEIYNKYIMTYCNYLRPE